MMKECRNGDPRDKRTKCQLQFQIEHNGDQDKKECHGESDILIGSVQFGYECLFQFRHPPEEQTEQLVEQIDHSNESSQITYLYNQYHIHACGTGGIEDGKNGNTDDLPEDPCNESHFDPCLFFSVGFCKGSKDAYGDQWHRDDRNGIEMEQDTR